MTTITIRTSSGSRYVVYGNENVLQRLKSLLKYEPPVSNLVLDPQVLQQLLEAIPSVTWEADIEEIASLFKRSVSEVITLVLEYGLLYQLFRTKEQSEIIAMLTRMEKILVKHRFKDAHLTTLLTQACTASISREPLLCFVETAMQLARLPGWSTHQTALGTSLVCHPKILKNWLKKGLLDTGQSFAGSYSSLTQTFPTISSTGMVNHLCDRSTGILFEILSTTPDKLVPSIQVIFSVFRLDHTKELMLFTEHLLREHADKLSTQQIEDIFKSLTTLFLCQDPNKLTALFLLKIKVLATKRQQQSAQALLDNVSATINELSHAFPDHQGEIIGALEQYLAEETSDFFSSLLSDSSLEPAAFSLFINRLGSLNTLLTEELFDSMARAAKTDQHYHNGILIIFHLVYTLKPSEPRILKLAEPFFQQALKQAKADELLLILMEAEARVAPYLRIAENWFNRLSGKIIADNRVKNLLIAQRLDPEKIPYILGTLHQSPYDGENKESVLLMAFGPPFVSELFKKAPEKTVHILHKLSILSPYPRLRDILKAQVTADMLTKAAWEKPTSLTYRWSTRSEGLFELFEKHQDVCITTILTWYEQHELALIFRLDLEGAMMQLKQAAQFFSRKKLRERFDQTLHAYLLQNLPQILLEDELVEHRDKSRTYQNRNGYEKLNKWFSQDSQDGLRFTLLTDDFFTQLRKRHPTKFAAVVTYLTHQYKMSPEPLQIEMTTEDVGSMSLVGLSLRDLPSIIESLLERFPDKDETIFNAVQQALKDPLCFGRAMHKDTCQFGGLIKCIADKLSTYRRGSFESLLNEDAFAAMKQAADTVKLPLCFLGALTELAKAITPQEKDIVDQKAEPYVLKAIEEYQYMGEQFQAAITELIKYFPAWKDEIAHQVHRNRLAFRCTDIFKFPQWFKATFPDFRLPNALSSSRYTVLAGSAASPQAGNTVALPCAGPS